MAYTIKRTPSGGGQVDISSIVQWQSLAVNLILTKQVSTVSFDVQNIAGRTMPVVGDTLDIYDGATHIFGGRITDKLLVLDGGLLSRYTYNAVDWTYNLDAKMVVKTYTNQDPGAIVQDIITNFTSGFTQVNVALAGYTIPSVAFNYQPPSKCLQKICTLIGWDWYVDANKDVHFFNTDVHAAPFGLTDTSQNYNFASIQVDTSIQNLKNSVYVIGGNYRKNYTSTTTPDVYTTDGVAMVFPLAYSYDPATIQVTLAGVAQVIGIDQQNTFTGGITVLYNAGSNGRGAFIRFNTAPTAAQTLKTFGDASIPVLGHAIDASSIGTYGEFQDSIVDKLITTVAEAQSRAKAEIALYGKPAVTVNFRTQVAGLMVGQTISVQSTLLGITAQNFSITRITVSALSPSALAYDVQGEATDTVTFTDIMTLLLEAELMQNQVDSSTILEVLLGISESIASADSVTSSSSSGPYLWGSFNWGFGTWGP